MNPIERTLLLRRKALGKRQYQIATKVGVSQGMVAKVEDGERIPKRRLAKWADAYRVSVTRFEMMLQAVQDDRAAAQWALPLWQYGECKTPAEIEHIDCTRKEIKSA